MSANLGWTVEQAWAANEAALAADSARSDADPTLPLYQWAALFDLEDLRQQHEAGDRSALLAAIMRCAEHDLVLPEWVAKAYIAGYARVLRCEVNSWDAVFGTPYPAGSRMGDRRNRRNLRMRVWLKVRRIRNSEPATPIDVALFERVGAAMAPPIGPTVASELYYEAAQLVETAIRPGSVAAQLLELYRRK